MIEPPEGRLRKHEVRRAACNERLEMFDGGVAVGRVIPRPLASLELWEVPGSSTAELEESLIAAAGNEDGRAVRNHGLDKSAQLPMEWLALGSRAFRLNRCPLTRHRPLRCW